MAEINLSSRAKAVKSLYKKVTWDREAAIFDFKSTANVLENVRNEINEKLAKIDRNLTDKSNLLRQGTIDPIAFEMIEKYQQILKAEVQALGKAYREQEKYLEDKRAVMTEKSKVKDIVENKLGELERLKKRYDQRKIEKIMDDICLAARAIKID